MLCSNDVVGIGAGNYLKNFRLRLPYVVLCRTVIGYSLVILFFYDGAFVVLGLVDLIVEFPGSDCRVGCVKNIGCIVENR